MSEQYSLYYLFEHAFLKGVPFLLSVCGNNVRATPHEHNGYECSFVTESGSVIHINLFDVQSLRVTDDYVALGFA